MVNIKVLRARFKFKRMGNPKHLYKNKYACERFPCPPGERAAHGICRGGESPHRIPDGRLGGLGRQRGRRS